MNATTSHPRCLWAIALLVGCWTLSSPVLGARERFVAREGAAIEVWRITNDPTVRDHANYHNTQCWSPDGRYLCFTHDAASDEVHLYDLQRDRDVRVDLGGNPRWANRRNWLFYTRRRPEDGPRHGKGTHVMWLDVATGKQTRIGYGVRQLKETDCGDRWLYGIQSPEEGKPRGVRIPIRADSDAEILPGDWGVGYNSLNINPLHPLIVSRDHGYPQYYYATPDTRDIPFVARHFFDHDLAGGSQTKPFPIMEGSHFSWSGDGSYFMAGNGPMRGRKWDEPLPSNIHFLANTGAGDICPCGFSGRWICGSTGGGRGPLRVADLRSGEGWVVTRTYSFLCFPSDRDLSGPYDIDAKGSPDGTKIAFISTYDLKDGPATVITAEVTGDRIPVQSTEGFPESGRLVNTSGFGGEVLAYARKTPTSFEGLTRALYGTAREAALRVGGTLTSFEAAVIPKEQREGLTPPSYMRNIVKDIDSPLMWQRASDLYVAVVRLPDPPHMRRAGARIELIPGENHWETYGYHIYRDGIRITDTPARPGATMELPGEGKYTARAVEWSGLESRDSLPLTVKGAVQLHVLSDKPADFEWTHDRYLSSDGKEITEQAAKGAPQATREIVHLHDGVIHRERWQPGQIVRRHDLNLEGKAIRRLFYEDGRLTRREYWDREGNQVSSELFDADGYITESLWGETRRWHYRRAVPIRYETDSTVYVKQGERWVAKTKE